MSPALAPGMHLTMVAGVANATFLGYRAANYQGFVLSGCVAEWGNVDWLKRGQVDSEPRA